MISTDITSVPFFSLPAGEDAAWGTMSSVNLCPPSVFRCSLFPSDEWKEAHMDLPSLWQARSIWAPHYWWVRRWRACFDLSRPCSFVSKFLKFVLCNFEYLYVMPVWGSSLKLQRCFRDSWYKLNHAPTCTAFFFFFLFIWSGMKTHCVSKFVILHLLFIYVTEATLVRFIYQHNR